MTEAADVDTGLLLGAGWPFFLGGITKHLDQIGMSERLFGHTFADLAAAEFERAAPLTRNTRERDLLLDRAKACVEVRAKGQT